MYQVRRRSSHRSRWVVWPLACPHPSGYDAISLVDAQGGVFILPAPREEEILSGSFLRRRLLSGSAWASVGRIGEAMFGIFPTGRPARMLSQQELGAYFLALTIVSLGAVVGSLGLPKTVVGLVAENMGVGRPERARRGIRTVLGLGGFGALGISLAYLWVGDLVSEHLFHSSLLVGVTGLLAGWIAIAVVQEITAETFRGFHDIRLATLLGGLATAGKSGGLIMRVVLLGVLVLLWVRSEQTSLATVMLVCIGSGSVSVVVSLWLLYGKVSSLGSLEGAEDEEPVSAKEVLDDAIPFLAIAPDLIRPALSGHLDLERFGLTKRGCGLRRRLQAGHLRGDAFVDRQPGPASHRRGNVRPRPDWEAGAYAAHLQHPGRGPFPAGPDSVHAPGRADLGVGLQQTHLLQRHGRIGAPDLERRKAHGRVVRLLRAGAAVHRLPEVDVTGQRTHQPSLFRRSYIGDPTLWTRRGRLRSGGNHGLAERDNGLA